MTKVTVMQPNDLDRVRAFNNGRSIEEIKAENELIREALYQERCRRSDPPSRLRGNHIVAMVLGGLFMVMTFVWSVVKLMAKQSQAAAERSHELSMKLVEELGDQPLTWTPGMEVAIYVGLFLAGFLIIWYVTSKAGVVP